MKLIIQIPCHNEEMTLPATIADIPREVEGFDEVKLLVIDDGSTDRTAQVARELGVHFIVTNKHKQGLAGAFRRGLEECLILGADVIVNTDGDNQYAGKDIAKLVQPILAHEADMVIGDRQTHKISHFPLFKRFLQWFGSAIVRKFSGIQVPDAVSGFRAFSRTAALRMNIVSAFSYTIETIIQAGHKNITVVSVAVETNPKTRESRLFSSVHAFIYQQVSTIIRMYTMYHPLRVFMSTGLALLLIGTYPIARFIYYYLNGDGSGHIQSLTLGSALVAMGFAAFLAGMVADLIGFNRKLLEMSLERIRLLEHELIGLQNASELPAKAVEGEEAHEHENGEKG